jgi:hypothetical protein
MLTINVINDGFFILKHIRALNFPYTNGNVLTVKRLLGHKRIENTMKYISMIHFKDDQFEVTTATDIEEAKKVLSAGFEYVTQKDGIMLFRRPKRFC